MSEGLLAAAAAIPGQQRVLGWQRWGGKAACGCLLISRASAVLWLVCSAGKCLGKTCFLRAAEA